MLAVRRSGAEPGAAAIEEVKRAVAVLERDGALHAVNMSGAEDSLATDRSVGEDRETVAQMLLGRGQGRVHGVMVLLLTPCWSGPLGSDRWLEFI